MTLLPNVQQCVRTDNITDLNKPTFGESLIVKIALTKVYTKTLQISVICVINGKEEMIVCIHLIYKIG